MEALSKSTKDAKKNQYIETFVFRAVCQSILQTVLIILFLGIIGSNIFEPNSNDNFKMEPNIKRRRLTAQFWIFSPLFDFKPHSKGKLHE